MIGIFRFDSATFPADMWYWGLYKCFPRNIRGKYNQQYHELINHVIRTDLEGSAVVHKFCEDNNYNYLAW